MSPSVLNVLTPWGWAAAGMAALVSLVLLAGAAGFRWDPLRLTERRLERTRAELAVARSDVAARRIEQEAEAGQGARLDVHHRQTEAAARLSAAAATEARKASDAQIPLDPHRARRLRELDRRLCGLAPDLAGCAAASDPALEATRSCALAVLPEAATLGDLETAYALRGAQLASCDSARRLAVDTLLAERAAVDAWLKTP